MSNNQKISFWNLLKKQNVIIPIIQRDYAQGREGKEYLRQKFLGDLKEALDGGSLTLDFVYGSQKGNGNIIEPLDGQQRLTTLWLLHWYIAYKTGLLENEYVQAILKKFSYETRVSSREFCEKLCELKLNENSSLLDYIQQQTWFFSVWKQDPTIQAMLRMLCGVPNSDEKNKTEIIDGIDELLGKCTKDHLKMYWERLTKDNSIECPITFYEMTIGTNELPLSDDLYIKMNARGKPLTSFENFKADLIGWIYSEENKYKFGDTEDIQNRKRAEYASLIDNQWTDVFWENSNGNDGNIGHVDEVFFAFINRYFYNLVLTEGNNVLTDDNYKDNNAYNYFNDTKNSSDLDRKIAYKSFEYYQKYLDVKVLEQLNKIFLNLIKIKNTNNNKNINEIFQCSWNNDFNFIPQYVENFEKIKDNAGNEIFKITTINQPERVVFYAICKYLAQDTIDNDNLQHWMRFVWNLVSEVDGNRPAIRTIGLMKEAISLINNVDTSNDVYTALERLSRIEHPTNLGNRYNDEIEKASQIINSKGGGHPNESEIIDAENYAFFHGAIRFLFWDKVGNIDWGNFGEKWTNIQKYIPVIVEERHTIKQMIPYLDDNQIKQIFEKRYLVNDDDNLCKLLLKYPKDVHDFLLSDGSKEADSQLQKDLMSLCEQKQCLYYNVSKKYNKSDLLVLTYFKTLCPSCEQDSYVIGESCFLKFEENILNDSEINIINPKEQHCQGVYIKFKYKDYCFRWNKDNWVDMYVDNIKLWDKGKQLKNEGNVEAGKLYTRLHTHYKVVDKYAEYHDEYGNTVSCVFTDADSLKKELDRCIKIYEDIQRIEKNS